MLSAEIDSACPRVADRVHSVSLVQQPWATSPESLQDLSLACRWCVLACFACLAGTGHRGSNKRLRQGRSRLILARRPLSRLQREASHTVPGGGGFRPLQRLAERPGAFRDS